MVHRSRAWITLPRLYLRPFVRAYRREVGARCEHITAAHALASCFIWPCRRGSYVIVLSIERKAFISATCLFSISPLRNRSSFSSL
ncbi:hypothetical protein ACJIZ3_021528 [Penstemon smallii]|uniref:Uncharacterized protein n=1 Tax=Penstemon smallii TaxID=265156 RepID=A0ABD3SLP5_9LAMI